MFAPTSRTRSTRTTRSSARPLGRALQCCTSMTWCRCQRNNDHCGVELDCCTIAFRSHAQLRRSLNNRLLSAIRSTDHPLGKKEGHCSPWPHSQCQGSHFLVGRWRVVDCCTVGGVPALVGFLQLLVRSCWSTRSRHPNYSKNRGLGRPSRCCNWRFPCLCHGRFLRRLVSGCYTLSSSPWFQTGKSLCRLTRGTNLTSYHPLGSSLAWSRLWSPACSRAFHRPRSSPGRSRPADAAGHPRCTSHCKGPRRSMDSILQGSKLHRGRLPHA